MSYSLLRRKSVSFEKKRLTPRPGKKQLLKLAQIFDIKAPEKILDEVRSSISNWNAIANDCGVSTSSRNRIAREIASLK